MFAAIVSALLISINQFGDSSLRTKAVIEDNDTAFSCQTTGHVTIAFDSKIDKNCLGRSGLYSGYSIYF